MGSWGPSWAVSEGPGEKGTMGNRFLGLIGKEAEPINIDRFCKCTSWILMINSFWASPLLSIASSNAPTLSLVPARIWLVGRWRQRLITVSKAWRKWKVEKQNKCRQLLSRSLGKIIITFFSLRWLQNKCFRLGEREREWRITEEVWLME